MDTLDEPVSFRTKTFETKQSRIVVPTDDIPGILDQLETSIGRNPLAAIVIVFALGWVAKSYIWPFFDRILDQYSSNKDRQAESDRQKMTIQAEQDQGRLQLERDRLNLEDDRFNGLLELFVSLGEKQADAGQMVAQSLQESIIAEKRTQETLETHGQLVTDTALAVKASVDRLANLTETVSCCNDTLNLYADKCDRLATVIEEAAQMGQESTNKLNANIEEFSARFHPLGFGNPQPQKRLRLQSPITYRERN